VTTVCAAAPSDELPGEVDARRRSAHRAVRSAVRGVSGSKRKPGSRFEPLPGFERLGQAVGAAAQAELARRAGATAVACSRCACGPDAGACEKSLTLGEPEPRPVLPTSVNGVMRRLLQATRPDALALALLVLAAVGVFVAGFQHARLFHRGYADVEVVGLLFFMNAIGSMVVVLTLVAERVWLYVLGAVSVCGPSLVSIAISHSSIGFLGFREGGYDADALVIVAAEVWAVVFALLGAAVAVRTASCGEEGDDSSGKGRGRGRSGEG
jgi:hypothetical protein